MLASDLGCGGVNQPVCPGLCSSREKQRDVGFFWVGGAMLETRVKTGKVLQRLGRITRAQSAGFLRLWRVTTAPVGPEFIAES